MHYIFGDYILDPLHYELRQAGWLIPVEQRVFDVLAYLVQHPGQTVTTGALMCFEQALGPCACSQRHTTGASRPSICCLACGMRVRPSEDTVIAHNLCLIRVAIPPLKIETVLVVDAEAMPPLPVASQRL
jgi:hypothetical protein